MRVKRTLQFILLPLLSDIFTLNIYFILLDSLEIPRFLKCSISIITEFKYNIMIEFKTKYKHCDR